MPYFRPIRLVPRQPWRSCWRCLQAAACAAADAAPGPEAAAAEARPARAWASNHRLILKDGTYQMVRKYEIVGDRVRYISVERGGDWEELPVDLVDWDATRKWERDHAEPDRRRGLAGDERGRGYRQRRGRRTRAEKARRPEVAKGLELPDEDGVFALDTFEGTPELVELTARGSGAECEEPARAEHAESAGRLQGQPGTRGRACQGSSACERSGDLSFAGRARRRRAGASHALTVETGGAKEVTNRKHGAHSRHIGICDCARGRAQGGAHCGRHPRKPHRHGHPGRKRDSRQGRSAGRQALAQDHAATSR